jgi:2-alkyl-3-oxoalkanoate reductase
MADSGNAVTRVGIVGAGYVSAHHLRALKALPFVEVIGICDQDESRAQAIAVKFGIPAVYHSLAEMAAARPNVIHILTPPASHYSLAMEALDMGCHVFVEKPMAESAEECDRLIERAREKGLVLSVNHSDRFDPVVLQAIEAAKSGACGDIIAVHSIRSSDYPPYAGGPLPAPYRQGSYPFRDLGVHGLYLLESFLGPVENLSARYFATGRDPMLTFDEWRAQADCRTGTGYLYLSWNTRPIQSELQIHGTRGVIHIDRFLQICEVNRTLPGPKQIGIILNGFRNALKRSFKIPLNLIRFLTGSLKPSPGIYAGVQAFHRALHDKHPVPVPAEEGRRIMAWIASASAEADREKEALMEAELSKPLPQARVLVTGGAGFLGSALVERLRQDGESVRLLLRRPPKRGSACDPELRSDEMSGEVSIVYGSLGQPEFVDRAVAGVDVVYHVGAAMKGGKEEFEQGTIWGTWNVIEACIRHGVKRLVYVSSLSVVDHAGHPNGVAVTENTPYEPFPERRGAYTQTKLRAEQMVLSAIRDRNLPAVVVRPGQIFGPGAEHTAPNGVISIAGKWMVAGSGDRRLPLVYRDDVVDALLRAEISSGAVGQVINIVDPYRIDQNEYLAACKSSLGSTKIYRVPIWFFMLMATGIEFLGKLMKRDIPLTPYRVRSLKPLWPFDIRKAKELLDWTPAVGTEEGLRRTFPSHASDAKDNE